VSSARRRLPRPSIFALGLATWLLAPRAPATEPSDLSCEPQPSPPPGDTAVPINPLLFGFGIQGLTDPNGQSVLTIPAPAPWDLDARYRVPATPLSPNTTYAMTYELQVATATGTFTTSSERDTQPPTAPGALWHAQAANPNQFSICATDETELFGLAPSTDDLTLPGDLRYSLSRALPDGGLAMLFNELTPVTLADGGAGIAVQYGLEGLPGDYVLQARDLAGNLSAPSAVQRVEIGPGCTFASSTTGRRQGNLWVLLGLLLSLGHGWRRRNAARERSPART
jgi:hypothetical protein